MVFRWAALPRELRERITSQYLGRKYSVHSLMTFKWLLDSQWRALRDRVVMKQAVVPRVEYGNEYKRRKLAVPRPLVPRIEHGNACVTCGEIVWLARGANVNTSTMSTQCIQSILDRSAYTRYQWYWVTACRACKQCCTLCGRLCLLCDLADHNGLCEFCNTRPTALHIRPWRMQQLFSGRRARDGGCCSFSTKCRSMPCNCFSVCGARVYLE
jgi:hypothetical protein